MEKPKVVTAGYWYLAQPYTGMKELSFYNANAATAKLMRMGLYVFSPIAMCHTLAKEHVMPTDFAYWRDFNHAFLSRAEGMIIFMLPGWQQSLGVADEIKLATELNLKVAHMSPTLELDFGVEAPKLS